MSIATDLPTSVILSRAADEIAARGWRTGQWGQEESSSTCLEGGILAAMGTSYWTMGEEGDFLDWLACPAYRAVHDFLNLPEGHELWRWNDEADQRGEYVRTEAEVIEVLRAAALIEAARERATSDARAAQDTHGEYVEAAGR